MRPVLSALRLLGGLSLAAVAAGTVLLGGCASGAVRIVELNFKRIEPSDKLVENIDYDQAYWWTQDDRLFVALGRERNGASPLARERISLSFVLEGLPADKGRDYPLDTNSLRAYVRRGVSHARYASTRGILGLRYGPSNTVTGRFRVLTRKQIFHALTGWSNAAQTVWVGEFTARLDEQRGRVILSETEEDGMDRGGRGNTNREAGRPVRIEGPPVKRRNQTP